MRQLPPLNMLRVFEEVARHESFSRAADALFVTQGAVSRQIKQLEEHLGVALVVRSPRGLVLTDAGRELAGKLDQAFDQLERALDALRAPGRPRLRVVAPPTWATRWLSARLRGFCQRHPDVALSVTSADDGEVDCHIRFGRAPGGELLAMERHVAVASPDLFDGEAAPALDRHPLLHILHEGRRLGVWDDWLAATGRAPASGDGGLEFGTLDQVIHAALAGGGLAVIDRQMIERELADGSLRPISPVETVGPYGYWLEVKAGRRAASEFAAWLRQVSQAR